MINNILVLRKINEDLKSNNGKFQYPSSGLVHAPDWNGRADCGGGLHGLPWGSGDFNIDSYGTQFMVLEVSTAKGNYVAFDGKCKFKDGYVKLITQSQQVAIEFIKAHPDYPKDTCINFDLNLKQNAISGYESTQKAGSKSTQKAGYKSTQEAGYKSTQKAGDESTQKAGYKSTQEAGDESTQKAGDESTQKAGYKSTQEAGYESTQKAGDESTQKAGYESTQKAGDESTQKAGYKSTQEAGYESTQKAGDESTQKAGLNSIQIGWWYDASYKYHVKSRTVTKTMANKPYFFKQGKWTLVK